MKTFSKIVLASVLASSLYGVSTPKKLICVDDMENYKYCQKLQEFHYPKTDDMDRILFMTDKLEYLSRKNTKDKVGRELSKKIFEVMKDINKTIKIAANEVRKQKYKAVGMIVQPTKYGSNAMLKYKNEARDVARGKLNRQIKDFFKQYDTYDDEFLTDILRINGATFILFPEIVQYNELKLNLLQNKEADFQIAIDGFFGMEKGMSESVVTLGLKIDRNNNIRRVFDRKAEYEKIKKALIELVDNALGDIASQEE
jgi:superoxide dismutase